MKQPKRGRKHSISGKALKQALGGFKVLSGATRAGVLKRLVGECMDVTSSELPAAETTRGCLERSLRCQDMAQV